LIESARAMWDVTGFVISNLRALSRQVVVEFTEI
jgi:hypothetical protein